MTTTWSDFTLDLRPDPQAPPQKQAPADPRPDPQAPTPASRSLVTVDHCGAKVIPGPLGDGIGGCPGRI